jgi:acyl-coenzyme A synthetase/AMP-(fatty) acid ligase
LTYEVALMSSGGVLVDSDEFTAEVSATARSWRGAGPIVNLCEDRRKFLVAFAAALRLRRTTLLLPSRAPSAVSELRTRYPGCETVDDSLAAAGGDSPAPDDGGDDFVAAVGHTSGSTGTPVAHAKTLRGFAATTALNAGAIRAELARLGAAGRPWIVATVPPQHMYGLETSVLLPLLAGFGVHSGKPLLPADVAAALAGLPAPRVLVTTPVHLRALVESSVAFPDIAIIVSATAPLDQDLAMRAEKRLGASLVEFFGSTETCVIATRRTALGSGWHLYPGVALATGGGGTTVSAPWLAHEELLHDIVEVLGDGTFRVIGRGADVIEVAGKRASLADLTQRLLAIEGVADATVFQPPLSGENAAGRCAALVVAPGLSAREVARRMRGTVDAVFIPRPIVVVQALPRNEVGKLPRERLLAFFATAALQPRRGR